jgi:hypothetical protein
VHSRFEQDADVRLSLQLYQNKYGDNARLLFTDTDSLAYHIKTEDFYADIASDVDQRFDTSDYPKDHPSGIKAGVNKKVVGMFKDEAAGKQIEEFVGLRCKVVFIQDVRR